MKRIFLLLFAGLVLTPFLSRSQGREDSLARKFLDLNQTGNFEEAATMFDPSVSAKISPTLLKQIWEQLNTQFGAFQGVISDREEPNDTLTFVYTSCNFEKASLTLLFVYNPADRLVGYRVNKVETKSTGPDTTRYKQEATELLTGSGKLYGTLMLPAKSGLVPVVLLIAGSGPTDRDGNSTLGETSDTYKLLAEGLASEGIASLRYDKRGIAESAASLTDERKLSLEDYINDAAGWVGQLKKDSRFSRVIIMGHSEGALIGMVAARQSGADAFISLSGAGMPLDSILLIQLKKNLNDTLYAESVHILSLLKEGKTTELVPSGLSSLFTPAVQPYLISEIHFNPAEEMAKLKIPVLIVQGNNDLQITVGDARRLAAADPRAELIIIDHMTHMLKDAGSTRDENLKTYADPGIPLDSALVPDIAEFLKTSLTR